MKKYKGIMFKVIVAVFVLCIVGSGLSNVFAFELEKKKEYVIVIDPGHGGTEKGAQYGGLEEKNINILVAEAMGNELSKYDNVVVHYTHTTADETMSIKDRAEFADEVGADYFFCLHFNASGNHNFYGSEAWVTSYGRYYSEMYAFSQILLDSFEEIGLYNRGIKTKLETDGTDYYGVLRRNAEFDIPAVIIEHCHMDNYRDGDYLNEDEDFELFGQIDATTVAKFLGLKSEELGVDYSDYEVIIPEEPESSIPNDVTNPICTLSFNEEGSFIIEAFDDEHDVIYYAIGFDEDVLNYELLPWNKEEGLIEIDLDDITIEGDIMYAVVFNAFNLQSETVSLNVGDILREIQEKNNAAKETVVVFDDIIPLEGGEFYLLIAVICILISIVVTVKFVNELVKDTKKGGNDNYVM